MNKNNFSAALLLLRLAMGSMMLLHGITKLGKGVGGIGSMLEDKGLPYFLSYGAFLGEVMAPLLLIVGFRTKLASLAVIFTMLTAIFLAHGNQILSRSETGGWAVELPALYLIIAVALLLTGGGKYALSSSNKWD